MHFSLFRATIQFFLILGNLIFYWTLVSFVGITSCKKLLTLAFAVAVLCLSFTFISSFALHDLSLWARSLYTISASWLGISYLLLLASVLSWVFFGIGRLLHVSLDRRVLIEIMLGIVSIVSLYGFINSGVVRTTPIDLHLHNLPEVWKGKTAVWVSDTHLGPVRNHGFAQRISTMVQDLHPDIVFVGGDLFDGEAVDLDEIIKPLAQITAPYGVYFITGNHEEFGDKTPYLKAVRRVGMRVLDNEMVDLDGLQIIGVDYMDTRGAKQFKTILQKIAIDPRRPSILLKHAPLNLQVARERGITVQLSGHTHHGQLFLLRFITSRVYQGYDYGLKWFQNLLVYTSSGAGTWGPPMRIDTIPEIVQITFR
jgi:predicted MPP superfamily phosphohydrolase